MNQQKPKETHSELSQIFPFEYIGGGYFREKGVKKNVKAQILHGDEAISFLYNQLTKEQKNG